MTTPEGWSAVAPYASQWDFDNTLTATVGGSILLPSFSAPSTKTAVSFTNVTIQGQPAIAAAFPRGNLLRATHRLAPNGGGTAVNQYSVIMDVLFESRTPGFTALLQTGSANSDDAEWFINAQGGLGILGVYGGAFSDNEWHRVILSVDAAAGIFRSYLDGVRVQELKSGISLDGRFALQTTALLFADNNQETSGGMINSLQIRSEPLTDEEAADLGGAQARGIPLPLPTGIQVVFPKGGETIQALVPQTVSWSSSNAVGLIHLELIKGTNVALDMATVPLKSSSYVWIPDRYISNGNDYRLRITSLVSSNVTAQSEAAFSVVGGQVLSPAYGTELQKNGGFESELTNWIVLKGNPLTLLSTQGKGSPHGGKRFFHGGRNTSAPEGTVGQRIDLLAAGFTAEQLDDLSTLSVEGWLRNQYSAGEFDDQVFLRVRSLDAAGNDLSSLRTILPVSAVWSRQQMTGLLPVGTRQLSLEVVGHHRRDNDNDSMADDLILKLGRPTPPLKAVSITKLPMLQDYRQNAMTLLWETDGNLAEHKVYWGREEASEHVEKQVSTLQIDTTHYVHQVTLTGLEAETSYRYRVQSGSQATPVFTFTTAPRLESAFAVAWWGDNHDGTTTLRTHVSNIVSHAPNMICVAGDMVNSGSSASEWHDYWFKPLEHMNASQTIPVLFARGNHDGEHALAYAYSALPGNGAWYSFPYGNSWFIFLDSEANSYDIPEQLNWLKSELQRPEVRRAAFRIVCFHRPPYTDFWNGGGYTGESWVQSLWTPILAANDVDLVISGHTHAYCRGTTNGVTYVVSGGGGGTVDTERVASWPFFTVEYTDTHFDLMEVDGAQLDWRTFSASNKLVDQFRLHSRAAELAILDGNPQDRKTAVTLTGRAGLKYILESSTDLSIWRGIATNTLTAASQTVTNAIPLTEKAAFLRARTAP